MGLALCDGIEKEKIDDYNNHSFSFVWPRG